MSHQLTAILSHWQQYKESHDWVLGTIIETQGSSYRKAGAMILINDLGQHFGLISGGCLESDLMRQAQKVMCEKKPTTVLYDMQDESDISWQLGIGCGGMVRLLLQPLTHENHYHQLPELYQLLIQYKRASYQLNLKHPEQPNAVAHDTKEFPTEEIELTIPLKAEPHIAIFGAGIDARPLVEIAASLGWQITLVDHRTVNARAVHFPKAHRIIREATQELSQAAWLQQIDAAVIMGHSLSFDAAALALVQQSSCLYVGLLGPSHRKEKVIARTKLSSLTKPLAGPIGLNLGGELPESIALSILAEIHAVLEQTDASSLSGQLSSQSSKGLGLTA